MEQERNLPAAGDPAADPAARQEYEMLKILAEHYFGSMLVTDDRGRFLYVSDGTCRLLGVDRETLMHISIYDTLKGYCFARAETRERESLAAYLESETGRPLCRRLGREQLPLVGVLATLLLLLGRYGLLF